MLTSGRLAFELVRTLPLRLLMKAAGVGRDDTFLPYSWSMPWLSMCKLHIGSRVQINHGTRITIPQYKGAVTIGRDTSLGRFNSIFSLGSVRIGSGCLFSDMVNISDSDHVFEPGRSPIFTGLKYVDDVFIMDNCFIGKNVTILPGVRMGSDCVVGAGTLVVSGCYPKGSKIVGVPGRIL